MTYCFCDLTRRRELHVIVLKILKLILIPIDFKKAAYTGVIKFKKTKD